MFEVVVQLVGPQAEKNENSESPLKIADGLGLKLEPMHPGLAEDNLGMLYHGYAQQQPTARSIAAVLRANDGVASAYVKPAVGLP